MTIRQMMREHPELFYSQDWYAEEDFTDMELPEGAPITMPQDRSHEGVPPEYLLWHTTQVVPAVVLVNLYVMNPTDPIWESYFWTSDLDHLGQRVYVGSNGMGLEIHRHLAITHRWGVPEWR